MKKREVLKYLKELAKFYDVKLKFFDLKSPLSPIAFYDVSNNTIFMSKEHISICSFFHELGHHYCVLTGKWSAYHSSDNITCSIDLERFIRTALKAERWVDDWGKNEMEMWFPDLEYTSSYISNEDRNWFKNQWLKPIKNLLNDLGRNNIRSNR